MDKELKEMLRVLLKEELESISKRFDNLEKSQNERFNHIDEKIDNLSTELRSHFKLVEDKLDQHHEVFNVVADEIKSVYELHSTNSKVQ